MDYKPGRFVHYDDTLVLVNNSQGDALRPVSGRGFLGHFGEHTLPGPQTSRRFGGRAVQGDAAIVDESPRSRPGDAWQLGRDEGV